MAQTARRAPGSLESNQLKHAVKMNPIPTQESLVQPGPYVDVPFFDIQIGAILSHISHCDELIGSIVQKLAPVIPQFRDIPPVESGPDHPDTHLARRLEETRIRMCSLQMSLIQLLDGITL